MKLYYSSTLLGKIAICPISEEDWKFHTGELPYDRLKKSGYIFNYQDALRLKKLAQSEYPRAVINMIEFSNEIGSGLF